MSIAAFRILLLVVGLVIVVWKLGRLSRSTRDLLSTMDTINEAAGKFQSVSKPWANTTTQPAR
jgi:DNA invertase Pin-like site-specific DNA recombinase